MSKSQRIVQLLADLAESLEIVEELVRELQLRLRPTDEIGGSGGSLRKSKPTTPLRRKR